MNKIYINGNVITVDEKNPRCQAFSVEDGCFSSVGDNESVLRLRTEDSQVIDLQGKTVIPGFNDCHIHLLNFAYSLNKVNLEGLNSVEEIIRAGREYIKEKKIAEGSWVLGHGWNHYFFETPRFLTRDDLDQISTSHPILFTRVCEHTVTVNTKALELMGIRGDTPNPEGGEIVRGEDGTPTGVLRETARYLAYEKLPPKSVEEIKDMLVRAMDIISSLGITSVQTDDFETFSDKDWRKVIKAYQELQEEDRLKVRIYEQCLLPGKRRLQEFLDEGWRTGAGSPMFRIGPLKLLCDGSLGPRSAYLSEPYSDAPDNRGIAVFTQEELEELLVMAGREHMQIACHAIGDAAITMVLDGFDRVMEGGGNPLRLGIVHVQVGSEEIFRRMKEKQILAYVQPVFVQADMHCAESRLGSGRLRNAYKFNAMRKMGIPTAFSSDCPIESPSPIDGIYVAATRMDYNGYPAGGWYPEEKVEVEDAIRGYTLDGAYASFEENVKGSIEKGKYADFLVLSDDITRVPPAEIRDVKVEYTYLGGQIM